MDNIITDVTLNKNTGLLKNKFEKNMRKRKIDINFLKKNQFKLLAELKYKDETIILNESIKEKEEDRISSEIDELNNLIIFLRDEYRKQLKDNLRLETNSNSDILRTFKPLHVIKNSGLSDITLNKYFRKLTEADNIDFSLFYFGDKNDIFKEIFNSFIKPQSDYILLDYNHNLETEIKNYNIPIRLRINDQKKIITDNTNLKYVYVLAQDILRLNINKSKIYKNININRIDLEKEFTDKKTNIYKINNMNKLGKNYIDIIEFLYSNIDHNNNKFEYECFNSGCFNSKSSNLSFIEMCVYLDSIYYTHNYESIQKEYITLILNYFINYYTNIFEIYYFNYLSFTYDDNEKNIHINPDHIKEHSKKELNKYLQYIQNVLIEILENKNEELKKIIDFYNRSIISERLHSSTDNIIYETYITKIDKKFTSGFLLSTLYNFNKSKLYNISLQYLDKKYWYKGNYLKAYPSGDKEITDVDDYSYYFDSKTDKRVIHINTNKEMIRYLNEEHDKNILEKEISVVDDKGKHCIRIILSKKHLLHLQKSYNMYFKSVIIIAQKLIQLYEMSQKKYLYILDLFIIYDKKHFEYNKDSEIKDELKKYFKSKNQNIQTNTDIIIQSTSYFSGIIFKLNEKLLRIIDNEKSVPNKLIDSYDNFITEYSLWIVNIVAYISDYPNNSKHIYHLEKILDLFMNQKHIKKWYNNCITNNLHYWLPVFYSGKSNFSFFLNIINNKKSYKIKPNDLIIVKYKNIDNNNDDMYCWNNNHFNVIVDDSYDRILIFIKKYIKCEKTLDFDDFNVIKSLVDRCDKTKINYNKMIKKKENMIKKFDRDVISEINDLNQKMELSKEMEHNCKNLISYHQIIKEIIKVKYPLRIDNNNNSNLNHLNTTVRKYQAELYKEYNTEKNVVF